MPSYLQSQHCQIPTNDSFRYPTFIGHWSFSSPFVVFWSVPFSCLTRHPHNFMMISLPIKVLILKLLLHTYVSNKQCSFKIFCWQVPSLFWIYIYKQTQSTISVQGQVYVSTDFHFLLECIQICKLCIDWSIPVLFKAINWQKGSEFIWSI